MYEFVSSWFDKCCVGLGMCLVYRIKEGSSYLLVDYLGDYWRESLLLVDL